MIVRIASEARICWSFVQPSAPRLWILTLIWISSWDPLNRKSGKRDNVGWVTSGGANFSVLQPQRATAFEMSRSAATIVGVDRFPYPFDRELDIVRLQMAPAVNFGQVPIFRVTVEVFRS
jgi:hypothetical protein